MTKNKSGLIYLWKQFLFLILLFFLYVQLLLWLFLLIEKENLCLYGHPDETWEVSLPAEEVPPELPEPALGINFARDGMNRRDWLSLVAVHSDCWLLSVAFYLGARLNRNERYFLRNSVIWPASFIIMASWKKCWCLWSLYKMLSHA